MRPAPIMPQWLYDDLARIGPMSAADAKALWDRYDGSNNPNGISGEAIHFYLNSIGEGAHCAV